MYKLPKLDTGLKTDVILGSLASDRYVGISEVDASYRRRLLYEGAAAEVAGTMLAFLRSHRTGKLNPTETEQLQRQIQKALWLHPQGTKEGVEEAVAYLTQVLSDVYGIPLGPVHPDVSPYREHPGHLNLGEGQLPQARSPALLPQPYTVKEVTQAQPSEAQQPLEIPTEPARAVYQDTATQTTDNRGSQAGEQGSAAVQGTDVTPSAGRSLRLQTGGAPGLIPDGPFQDVRPPQVPVEQHLDRYYLAAAGRELDTLTHLLGSQGTSNASVPTQGRLQGFKGDTKLSRQRERPEAERVEIHSRKSAAPSQKRVTERPGPRDGSSTSGAELEPVQPSASVELTAVAASLQKEPQILQASAGGEQRLPWAQGAWMEQIVAVAAAAASAASAAVQAQQTQQSERLSLAPGHQHSVLPQTLLKQDLPMQREDISGSLAVTGSGPAVPISAAAQTYRMPVRDAAAAAHSECQPLSFRADDIERNVQTEMQATARHLVAAAAPVWQGLPPQESERPVQGRPMHSPEVAAFRREAAPGPSKTAQVERTKSSSTVQAVPTGPFTPRPLQALQYPAVLSWPPSIHAPAAPPFAQQHVWGSATMSGRPSAVQQAPASAGPIGNTSLHHPEMPRPSAKERVEEPARLPAFDYTKARAALQQLQKAPEYKVAIAGARRVIQVPAQPPSARGDLRKRAVSPTRQVSARPATPPGFAPPPAPKRPHLAFGTRAVPPPSAPSPGAPAPPTLVPRVARLGPGKSGSGGNTPLAPQKSSVRAAGGARCTKAVAAEEEQPHSPDRAGHKRDNALRALAALLLQPQTLQLLRPDRVRTSPSSSDDDDRLRMHGFKRTPSTAMASASAEAPLGDAHKPGMAEKGTQCSPDRAVSASGAPETDRPTMELKSPSAQKEQLPQRCSVGSESAQGPVMVDREVQSAPEASEAPQLATLRASLVEHIAEAVAARLFDSQVLRHAAAETAGPADLISGPAAEAQPLSAADAACTIQLNLHQGSHGSNAAGVGTEESAKAAEDSNEASPQPPVDSETTLAVEQPSRPTEPSNEEDPNQDTAEDKGTETPYFPGEKEVTDTAGSWIDQWRERLTQEEMEQAAQEVIAEELARLLDSWDGAPGSLPSALHGLAQQRTSPPPPATAAGSDAAGLQESPQPHGAPAEPPTTAALEHAGGGSMERQVRAEEAAGGVQERVQELLQRQQAAGADLLLHAILESLVEGSLERLGLRAVPGSPQQAAHAQRATAGLIRHPPAVDRRFTPGRGGALMQGSPSRHGADDALRQWGAGFWQPVKVQQGRAGGSQARPERVGRADRVKSLERLKRRRQTAQRRDAAVSRPELSPNRSFRRAQRAPSMARVRGVQGTCGLQEGSGGSWDSAAGQHSRPASADLQEHHRSRARSEDVDEDEGHMGRPHLRLLQRPQPPNSPRLHVSPPGHLEDASAAEGECRWAMPQPPRVHSPPVPLMTRPELYAARRRRLVAEAGLTDPLLFSSTSTSASASISNTSSALMGRAATADGPAGPAGMSGSAAAAESWPPGHAHARVSGSMADSSHYSSWSALTDTPAESSISTLLSEDQAARPRDSRSTSSPYVSGSAPEESGSLNEGELGALTPPSVQGHLQLRMAMLQF